VEQTNVAIGKYQILDELGRGGFATVHRAVDTTLEREVALKVLDPLLVRDTAWVARFRREARVGAAMAN
jgi:serine/threonine protein kinase